MANQEGINIGGDENDINYRYKMPPLQTKIEGRGNGIKTVVMNMTDVAKALHTEPQYPTKFFGMEVGAVSQWDKKRDVSIVNGKHETKDFQNHLKKFISQFILCQKCGLPELTHKVNQDKQLLLAKCASCGWKGRISSTHKVKTYIINHPPKKKRKPKTKSTSITKPKDDKKEDGKTTEMKLNLDAIGGANDDVWSVDISDEAVAKRKQQELAKLANKKTKNVSNSQIDDDNDNDNDNDKDKDKNSPAYVLRHYMSQEKRSVLEIIDEIKRIKLSRKFDLRKTIQITFDALCNFKTYDEFMKSLKENANIFEYFTNNNKISIIENTKLKNSSAHALLFIGVLEEIIAKRNREEFLKRTYYILYSLYENNVLSKEQLLAWNKTPTDEAPIVDKEDAEAIRQKAKPFIQYLENEDDEDDDDDEEEDDDDDDE